ncbi:hypothetical protein [Riemerella columbina]|uniref:hypothetical protein n=1 Tax=Riemerella columbina TaxID=103810 RepID=UPI00266FD386|nr:hypothetical protein [Riemerella columbina]WKS95542.1 DUF5025 domain-containing protein [Riemerella columbina]
MRTQPFKTQTHKINKIMKHLFSALLVGLLLTTCKERTSEDPQNQLPPITQNGANTAGCLVNGKVLIPRNGVSAIPTVYGLYININNYNPGYYIRLYNVEEKRRMYIYVQSQNKTGNFTINQSNGNGTGTSQTLSQMFYEIDNKKYLSSDHSGLITITRYDYPIVSGTFSATLYNEDNPSEKIQITDGRFDINVATLNK